jgi:anaerobic selenocysteine-containing dehydrogenase
VGREFRTTCNRDCPDSYGIIATVENGRIIEHRGDSAHGVTQGFLWYRGRHYLDPFYSKERILHPQLRTEIAWDDALDLAAEKLSFYRDIVIATSAHVCCRLGPSSQRALKGEKP